jgi:hypothetical protein
MALLTTSSGTSVLIAFLVMARSWCFLIEYVLAISSLLDEVVIASDVVLGGVVGEDGSDDMAWCFSIECVLAVASLLDEVAIASDVVLGGFVVGGVVAGEGVARGVIAGAVIAGAVVAGAVVAREDVVLGAAVTGEDGSDDMALTGINRLEGALMEVQS